MKECSVSDCARTVLARGYCGTHYSRWRNGKPLDEPVQTKNPGALCVVDGCDSKRVGKGFCRVHWERNRTGVPLDQPIRKVLRTATLIERLRTYSPEGAPDECWEWTRALNKGYGMISVGNMKLRGAHIVAWELANNRTLPPGMVIRHRCDNPPCTNPAHLLLGTHGDNVKDRVEHGVPNKGVDNPQAKLTDDDVRTIRRLYGMGMAQKVIGDQFGINQANVSFIVNQQTWKHL